MIRAIFAPGSCVKCGEHNARVMAVTLREGFVGYQVSWWVNSERRMDNVSESELIATDKSEYMYLYEDVEIIPKK